MRRAAAALLGLVLLASTPLAAAPPAVGDVNGDGSVDVLDVFALVNFLFAGGPAPVGSGDVDGDGAVTVADVFYFINFLFAGGPPPVASGWLDGWPTFAHDPAHTGRAPVAGQALASVHWSTPVDLASGTTQTHYGSPLITQDGNVVVTVKTGATDGFRVEGREPTGGSLIWQEPLDYALPPHNWIPVCQPTLTPENVLVMPASGGTVLRRASADAASSTLQRLAFYGLSEYESAAATYDGLVKINTPIVSDRRGNLYFGFVTLGATPANLTSGIARLGAGGGGTWTPVTAAANDAAMRQVVTNCAPALSADGNALYVAVRNGSSRGYLLRLDAGTLAPLSRVSLVDPKSGVLASLRDDGTSSPTVGPDGDVYCGVLENPTGFNHYRGWLLHFDAALATTKTPAEFGWDTTAAIVPASAVPSYAGSSSYLLFTKYNDYASVGGSGINRIAVLDPSETAVGPVTGATVMKEVLAIADPTPDPDEPGAVYEWCINAAAVDVAAKCVYANAEDGYLYRWDLATNTLSQAIQLSGGFFEAYTPTVVGKDGTVYAIQGGVLFAVGSAP
ncbi:MAG TPA: dockerin type I domain-containing protein [Thermoanaerobaculia bacterium]|nr:dockerin type I domain-containing protein [Thermoanaerobaculia bacterium]